MAALVPFEPSFSQLARAVAHLPERARTQLRVPTAAVVIWDVVVGVCAAAIGDDSDRPWTEKFADVMAQIEATTDPEVVVAAMQEIIVAVDSDDPVPGWARQFSRQDFHRYVQKSLGAAKYAKLRQALFADLAVVVPALRRAATAMMPYAVAMQDLASMAGRTPPGFDTTPPTGLLGVVLHLDLMLERALESALGGSLSMDVIASVPEPSEEDVARVLPMLRELIAGRSREQAERLSTVLHRKIQGARDAITGSADPVSQAANSLVELIDRMLRDAFSDEEVVQWVDANYPEVKNLTRVNEQGIVLPTKKGQALMFVHAGDPRADDDQMYEFSATVLVKCRRELEGLKHADTGDPSELLEVDRLMAAVEAFLLLVPSMLWPTRSRESLDTLYARLNPPRATEIVSA